MKKKRKLDSYRKLPFNSSILISVTEKLSYMLCSWSSGNNLPWVQATQRYIIWGQKSVVSVELVVLVHWLVVWHDIEIEINKGGLLVVWLGKSGSCSYYLTPWSSLSVKYARCSTVSHIMLGAWNWTMGSSDSILLRLQFPSKVNIFSNSGVFRDFGVPESWLWPVQCMATNFK